MKPAIWITGIGAATPMGHSFDSIADALLEGHSAIRFVDSFDVQRHLSQIAAPLDAIPCPTGWNVAEFERRPRLDQLALWCLYAALQDSGLWGWQSKLRIGVALGVGCEWLGTWQEDFLSGGSLIHEPHRESTSYLNRVTGELGLTGPCATVSTACSSGNYAMALARSWLQRGWADAVLTGGCECGVTPFGLAAFGNLRALSTRNHEPARASRPFDRERDGFVMGEGGAVLVLERAEDAARRSARPYGELAGLGLSSDAHHPVIPAPDGRFAEQAVHLALRDAAMNPDELDYINAHATSTPVGDIAEAAALRRALGSAVTQVPVSGTKSMSGHLLTAAAGFEAIVCLAALARQAVPPTINLENPDPACDLLHVANVAQPRRVQAAASNAFGFGGSNSCAIFKAA